MPKRLIFMLLIFLTACQTQRSTDRLDAPSSATRTADLIAQIDACRDDSVCAAALERYFVTQINQETEQSQVPGVDEAQAEEELEQDVIAHSAHQSFSANQPLLQNQRIQAALNEWLTWRRVQLLDTWHNYQYLKVRIQPFFERIDFPEPLMLGIIAQETGGRVHSVSSAGAGGLFQLMPATADRVGVKGTIGDYDARFHPETAARGAAQFIAEQIQHYGNDYAKILAAYNAGENRFYRLNRKHQNGDVWNKDFYYDLPLETQAYIPKVLAAMLIFQHPEQFNVDLTEREGTTAVVNTARDTSLSELAVCLGQSQSAHGWYRVLRNLNASLNAKRVIKANTPVVIPQIVKGEFEANCQAGPLVELAGTLHNADFPDRPAMIYYKIRQGDTLSSIAAKFKCTSRMEVARLNNIKPPRYLINAGKKLKIPQC